VLALAAGCSQTEPTALQGQGVVTPVPPKAPPPAPADPEPSLDPSQQAAATPSRRERAEAIRDSLPRLNTQSPEQLVNTLEVWSRYLRPEVMQAIRLGLTALPFKMQEDLIRTTQATGSSPTLTDEQLFRQAFGQVHGMRYDEFLLHVAPLVKQYQEQLPTQAPGPPSPTP
jgi:hypothetical protein